MTTHQTAGVDEYAPLRGLAFGPLVEATRRLLDAVTAADPPATIALSAAVDINNAAAILETYGVDERHAPAGKRFDLPGLGQPGLMPFVLDSQEADEVRGRVTFRHAHLGGGGAVHGGNLPLLFDEVLGRLAAFGRPTSRTAYLKVDYRRVTPIGVELQVVGRIASTEGRKIIAKGALLLDGDVLVDAEALFVLLRPGQP